MEHLLPQVREIAQKDSEERIQEIWRKRWIGYTEANKILAKMEDLLNHPKTHRMPNLLIKSETNNGKSFVLKRFVKMHQPYEDERTEEFHIPVVHIEVPSDPSPDALYALILRAMRIPYRDSFKKETKASKVFAAMDRFNVRMLLIDEIHVLMNTTRLRKAQLLDTLKYISNTAEIVIVGAGTSEAHTAIVSDGQLANRFKPVVLPRWQLNSEFRKLLATFERILPLRKPSDLKSQALSTEIYSMSAGWIGEIHEILELAAVSAIRNKEERITIDILRSLDWMTPEKRRHTGT